MPVILLDGGFVLFVTGHFWIMQVRFYDDPVILHRVLGESMLVMFVAIWIPAIQGFVRIFIVGPMVLLLVVSVFRGYLRNP